MKKTKPESEETPKDEQEETPEVQKKEAEEGTEEHGKVAIPEAFQVQATALVESCDSKPCLRFLSNLVNEKEDELRKSEYEKENKGNKKTPSKYSLDLAPSY